MSVSEQPSLDAGDKNKSDCDDPPDTYQRRNGVLENKSKERKQSVQFSQQVLVGMAPAYDRKIKVRF